MACRFTVRVSLSGLLMLAVLAGSARSFAADVKITDAARQHFNAGVALLRDPDGARYEEAYAEFKVAYQASPSWKILGNLGISAMKLERDGEAIDAFTRYLAEGKKEIEASERADIERDLGTPRAAAVNVSVTTTPAVVTITDERTPAQGLPIRNRYESQAGALHLQIRPVASRHDRDARGQATATLRIRRRPRQRSTRFATPATRNPAPPTRVTPTFISSKARSRTSPITCARAAPKAGRVLGRSDQRRRRQRDLRLFHRGTARPTTEVVDLGGVVPLYQPTDAVNPPIVFKRDDGVLVTRGAGRVRGRHEGPLETNQPRLEKLDQLRATLGKTSTDLKAAAAAKR